MAYWKYGNIRYIINAVLAFLTLIGILVALRLGIWNIRAQKDLQTRVFKKELLDDIEQWVKDIRNAENLSANIFKTDKEVKEIDKGLEKFSALRNEYIKKHIK